MRKILYCLKTIGFWEFLTETKNGNLVKLQLNIIKPLSDKRFWGTVVPLNKLNLIYSSSKATFREGTGG